MFEVPTRRICFLLELGLLPISRVLESAVMIKLLSVSVGLLLFPIDL